MQKGAKMEKEIRYLNAPINLLEGFLKNKKDCLENILYYGIYDYYIKDIECCDIDTYSICSSEFFGIQLRNVKRSYNIAKGLYEKYNSQKPAKFGLNLTIFWNYYKSDNKTEFELVCLLAFLAMKSIIQKKPYCRITNNYLLSRMAGYSKAYDISLLPSDLMKYSNEYQLKKIKRTLSLENWGLVSYGYTRGFYISFQLSLEDLIYLVEKKKLKNKQKEYKIFQDEARSKALKRINNEF